MKAVEFTTELTGGSTLKIPNEAAAQLPTTGVARVIVLTESAPGDADWQRAAYEQFVREDPPEDSIYDSLR